MNSCQVSFGDLRKIRRFFRTGATARLLATSCAIAALLACCIAMAPNAAAQPRTVTLWVPASVPASDLAPRADLFYEGMSGRLIRTDADFSTVLEARGARGIAAGPEEVLYIYLVEEAQRAEFLPPARVLVREGHEVLVATAGEAPVLTASASASLRGLKQPVRIAGTPIEWPLAGVETPAVPREVNPLIQQMVTGITETTYHSTWQTLDDFETRYAYTTQNNQATQWLLDRFHALGLSAEFHYFQDGGQRRQVIATLPGLVDPTRVVYICGHMDAISDTPNQCAPGADDNASGTNAVLEAARVMSQFAFQYTIKFACFNEEEQGMVGSSAYVSEIAQQGENVIACFDADMIAYRGTDPAPPDLVMYSNSASQPLTVTLTEAINTYTPGLLEPVVHVEALEGSDYASFWHHNYKAICAIEDEAWADDFCPWYHTCNDRIEQYPVDYAVNCTRAVVAAVAMTALPFDPSGSWLVLDSTRLDDDMIGGTQGNGDGRLNPGETIDLFATLSNIGQAPATHVHGTLTSTSGDVTILTSDAAWPDIPSGGQGTNPTGLRLRVSGTALDGASIPFTLTMTDDTGSRPFTMEFVVAAPKLSYYSHRLDDVSTGNANGVLDSGEVVTLPLSLANAGAQEATGVTAHLTSASPHVVVVSGDAGCAQIPVGGNAELTPPFQVAVSGDAPVGEVLSLDLAITAGAGYQAASGFKIKVGTNYYYEAEGDGPWSLVASGDNAVSGRWVRVDPNGTTYNGQQAQPEDDHTPDPGVACFVTGQGAPGGAAGDNDVDGGKTTLTTPTFDITRVQDPRFTYWRWYTNNLGNNPNQDTWLVQISSNGGTSWVDLERTTSSGNYWQQESFALTGLITPTAQVVARFVADDEGGNSLLEAAVDDIEISGTSTPVAVSGGLPSLSLSLDPVRPSPTAGGAVVSFTVPEAGPVKLQLFGVDGRLVRTLSDATVEAGAYRVVWNGRTAAGAAAAPGVYFCRLQAGEKTLSRRLIVVR